MTDELADALRAAFATPPMPDDLGARLRARAGAPDVATPHAARARHAAGLAAAALLLGVALCLIPVDGSNAGARRDRRLARLARAVIAALAGEDTPRRTR